MFIPYPLKSTVKVWYMQCCMRDTVTLASSLGDSRYWIKSNTLKQASKTVGKKQSICLLNLLPSVLWYSLSASQVVSQCDKVQSGRMARWHGSRRNEHFSVVRASVLLVKKNRRKQQEFPLQSLFLIWFSNWRTEGKSQPVSHISTIPYETLISHVVSSQRGQAGLIL